MTDLPPRAVLAQLDLPASRLVAGRDPGVRKSRRAGQGVEILSSRPYSYGDDTRQVDWKATARTGELHVKQRLADTSTPVHVLLDASSSMRFGTARSKWETAREAVVVLCSIAAMAQDPTVVTIAGESPARLPLQVGQRGVHQVGEALQHPPAWGQAGSLGRALAAMLLGHGQPSRVIVVTDIYVGAESLTTIGKLAGRHSVAIVEVHDDAELDMPKAGRMRLLDAEGSETLVVDTSNRTIREQYRRKVAMLRGRTRDFAMSNGIPLIELGTSADTHAQLLASLPRSKK